MYPQTTLDQAQQALAYLLNQNTVPSAESARRAFFITSSVQRIYRSFDFDVANTSDTFTTDSSGQVDLSDQPFGGIPMILRISDGTTLNDFGFVMQQDVQRFVPGDRKYWILPDGEGNWTLFTTEPNTSITVWFSIAPDISATQAAVFQPMVIGKGALIYYRQAQDPDADVSVEEDEFKQEVSELIDQQNRRRPQRFIRTRRDVYGHYIGQTSGGRQHKV